MMSTGDRFAVMEAPSGTVTFLFTDVEGSTRRWDEQPGAMRAAMVRHDHVVRSTIEEHGGFVFTTAGDEFCAAFRSPRSAVEAAVETQLRLGREHWGTLAPFRVRMAIHTGNADERDGDYFGPPLNRCARLLSLGSGGQILLSAATELLLSDERFDGVSLHDLGAHRLRDLDRTEHIFHVDHPDLPADFPPLPSEGPKEEAADRLSTGRQAFARQAWQEAYGALHDAQKTIQLDGEDLGLLAESAWWLGRSDEAIALWERAFGKLSAAGNAERAALIALSLAEMFHYRLAGAVSAGWMARAERMLADRRDTVAYGHLARWRTVMALEREGDLDRALELAEEVHRLGTDLGDANLTALGLQDRGRILVAMGRVDEGMALVDEAMVAAVGGELDAVTAGRSYCNMLSVCDQVADYRRAGEWVEAASAWCEAHSASVYPGICTIFKAEVKWRRGQWTDAAEDARDALEHLSGWTDLAAAAWYQLGEIELRAGRHDAAEEAFRAAHAGGRTPLPGLARLRLDQGDPDSARALLEPALSSQAQTALGRARLLPVWFDAALASGREQDGRDALDELESAAAATQSIALRATVAERRVKLALASGDAGTARSEAERAIAGWSELKMPYETAQARVLLAETYQASGNRAAAQLELDVAKATFTALGATADLERLARVEG